MTERTYVSTVWGLSPRLVEIASPTNSGSNSITIQDLHDSLKSNSLQASEADDSLENMDDEPIIDSAGKENLGGGRQVGITATLLNGQVAFEANKTPQASGTATSADVNGTLLTDTSGAFQTNNVERGAWIVNFNDQSVAEVLTVVDEDNIIHRVLEQGATNQWSIGDNYKIWNIVQKEISGGNIVAIDDLEAELLPIYPTFATQVVRSVSSSATLSSVTASDLLGVAQAVWEYIVDSGFTAEQVFRLIASANAAKLSGAAGTEVRIRDLADTKDRIIATVDDDGNRLNVVTDAN